MINNNKIKINKKYFKMINNKFSKIFKIQIKFNKTIKIILMNN